MKSAVSVVGLTSLTDIKVHTVSTLWVYRIIWLIYKSQENIMVYWSEPLTLDQRVAGSIPVNAWHFCPSARRFIHIAALHPGV